MQELNNLNNAQAVKSGWGTSQSLYPIKNSVFNQKGINFISTILSSREGRKMASMTDKNHSQSAHQIFQSLSLLPTPEFVCLIDDCNRILVNKRQGEWCLWEDHLNSSGALPAEGVFVLSTTPSCTVCLRTLAALCPFPIEVPTNREYVADILSASNPLAESDCEDVTECLRRQVFVFQGTRLRIFPVHLCRAMSSENLFNDDIGNAEIDIEHQNAVELEVMTQFGPHNTVARAENEPNFRHSRLHRIPRYNNRKDSSASAFDDAISSETGIAKQAEASMAALEMEELREENARLNSALACIREMMQQISGPARDLTTELSSDSAMFDYGETQTAVGIPITRKDEVFCPVLEEAHCHDWLQGAENLSYRDIWHRQHDNFEDTGEVTGVLEELNLDQEFNRCVQPPSVYRFKSGVGTEHFAYSTPCGSVSLDSTAPVSMESPSDSEGSRHRVKVADGACCLIDYQGDRPDALTEAAIERILDGPLHSVHRAARRDLARISASELHSYGFAC